MYQVSIQKHPLQKIGFHFKILCRYSNSHAWNTIFQSSEVGFKVRYSEKEGEWALTLIANLKIQNLEPRNNNIYFPTTQNQINLSAVEIRRKNINIPVAKTQSTIDSHDLINLVEIYHPEVQQMKASICQSLKIHLKYLKSLFLFGNG